MSKAIKKVDPKATAKKSVMEIVSKAITEAGMIVVDGADYGMTAGTIIVQTEQFDVQIKPITPKAGVERYEVVGE